MTQGSHLRVLSIASFPLLIVCALASYAQTQPGGNNSEATSFARAMTDTAKYTWPKGNIVWYIELTPEEIRGDILSYRRGVTYCKATIFASTDWMRQTVADQKAYVTSSLNVLHKPPAFQSKELDYYPNSSGEVVVKVGNRVVAKGTYTKTNTEVWLEPGTSRKETAQGRSLTATLSIVNEGGRIRFRGTTNLPESESILVSLEGPGYSGQTKAAVRNGQFSTELFSNRGRPLSSGNYSLQLNVFNPKTMLMVEAKTRIKLFQDKTVELSFKPTDLSH